MKSLKKNLLILISILLLGLMLRVMFINSSPSSMYGDELTIVLDAYSLLKTGHDQLGNFLPLTFPMGAGRPAGYVYGSMPFVAIFGPTTLGIRALSILSGLGIILLLYLIGRKMFSEKVGLLAAGIAAVSPWEISLSRGGFEAHFALFLALLGIYLFMIAKQKPLLYIFSALSFGLTFHTYPTYKVSLLLFLPLLLWFSNITIRNILEDNKRYFLMGVLVLVIFGILSLSQTFIGGSETRFSSINIFSQGEVKNKIEQKINLERQISNLPKTLKKYFYNKQIEYAKVFIENYLQNFSLDFLVLHGDRNPRHNMATMGGIYFIEIILIFIGLLNFWQRQKRIVLFLVFWLLLAPIPTAIVDFPHALRSSFMLPPLLFLSALGLVTVFNYRRRLVSSLIILAFVVQFVFFIQKLYFLAPAEYSNFWSYPAKLAVDIAVANKDKYDYVILSDKIADIEYAYPVYTKRDPQIVINQNKNRSLLSNYPMKKFDNVFIGRIPENELLNFINQAPGSLLYLGPTSEGKYLIDYEIIESLNKEAVLALKRK